MCLETDGKMLTAKEDITCYKVLRKRGEEYYAFNFPFEYKFKQTYRLRKKLIFHSNYGLVEKGFHSYENCPFPSEIKTYVGEKVVVVCTIPKGAKYYEGFQPIAYKGYVSTSIRIEKIIYEDRQ